MSIIIYSIQKSSSTLIYNNTCEQTGSLQETARMCGVLYQRVIASLSIGLTYSALNSQMSTSLWAMDFHSQIPQIH
ncbi:hypothetical protein FGO68_gene5070 [Halteria grandinella]|uniref:Uncharacterized protein n=1 Tax=Halteria grandinella TaxID=5974 RepID=A0A8J8NBR5_HALGN|nr:hypothetical protein FGO68_gene5070 [Halteria grandinella]